MQWLLIGSDVQEINQMWPLIYLGIFFQVKWRPCKKVLKVQEKPIQCNGHLKEGMCKERVVDLKFDLDKVMLR